MNPILDSSPTSLASAGALTERNRVLRNTYWQLALSMIPTVLGAWIGVTTGIARAMSPGIDLVVFLVGSDSGYITGATIPVDGGNAFLG